MSQSLFRKEAIQNNTQRLLGNVILVNPLSFAVITAVVLLVIVLVSILLAYGEYARREVVVGYLVPNQGDVKVYAPFSGVIDKKLIHDGQVVSKGQDLLEVSTGRGTFENVSVNEQLISQLALRKTSLESRIQDETRVFDSEKERLGATAESIRQELQQISQQLVTQKDQLALSKEQWQKYIGFKERGLVTEAEVVSRNNNYLNAKSNNDVTKRLRISKNTELENIETQLEQLPLRKSNRLQELRSSLTQLKERLIELESGNSYVVKAPIDGRVTAVQVNPGQSVNPNASILTIIPEDTTLYAELFLPSRAIGFINNGQKVLMRYDAFPYQRYGLYEGKVVQVAEAVINPNEARIPLPTQEPVYRVRVALDEQFVSAYGKEMPLQSGMSISADIILDKRSLGEWLLEPIYSLRGRI